MFLKLLSGKVLDSFQDMLYSSHRDRMSTAFDKPEWEVKLYYKASKKYVVKADTREEAHKLAYNNFLDTNPDQMLKESEIEDFFIETTIDGEEGSDMLHE